MDDFSVMGIPTGDLGTGYSKLSNQIHSPVYNATMSNV